MKKEMLPVTVEERLDTTPAPTIPEPHGLPFTTPMVSTSAGELRRMAEAAEARERAAEAERQRAEEAFTRLHRECERIARETMPVYDEIAAAVDRLGLGDLARRLEQAETAAMAAGKEVDPQFGAATVRDHLCGTRTERYRPFLSLVRSDRLEAGKE